MFDLFQERGDGYKIGRLSPERIKEIVGYPWSGAGFSERVWKNRDALGHTLKERLTRGLIRGDGHAQIAQSISEAMGVSYKAAARLVRTELNHLFNQAAIDGYKRDGIEEYRFIATLDARTCEECGALDRKKYKVAEAKTGVNLPPIHPNDRCATIPVVWEGLEDEGMTRIARREDRTTYDVPADMTYEEWRETVAPES